MLHSTGIFAPTNFHIGSLLRGHENLTPHDLATDAHSQLTWWSPFPSISTDSHPSMAGCHSSYHDQYILQLDSHQKSSPQALGASLKKFIQASSHASTLCKNLLDQYLRYGPSLVESYSEDFAYVIWDQQQHKVVASVDAFASRPLYYAWLDSCLIYSFHLPELIFALKQTPPQRQSAILNYCHTSNFHPNHSFYEGIEKLGPGQSLSWHLGQPPKRQQHQCLRESSIEHPDSPEQWVDRFKNTFMSAVSKRTHISKTGCCLSGGLDSSSITAMHHHLVQKPVDAISWQFPKGSEGDETIYQNLISSRGICQIHPVMSEQLDAIGHLNHWIEQMVEPFWFPNQYLHQGSYQQAQKLGLKFLLDGMDGDVVVSHGVELPLKYFRKAQLIKSMEALKALGDTFGYPPSTLFKRLILKELIHPSLLNFRNQNLSNHSSIDNLGAFLLCDIKTTNHQDGKILDPLAMVHKDYLTQHAVNIFDPFNSYIMEAQQRQARPYGLQIAYPFFDLDLCKLCLKMPDQLKISQGQTRWVLRQSMDGLLPPKVQWRKQKSSLGGPLHRQMAEQHHQNVLFQLEDHLPFLNNWLDTKALMEYHSNFPIQNQRSPLKTLWTAITLGMWLKFHKNLSANA
jgi:asparagine synthase (glutamine-hydrolysing)